MISVIVPVYNVEPYLRKCLDSIVGQTYRDLEILVIDDGSTDGSGAICDEYKRDDRVRVFHTENRGLSAARNLGLDNASGEWIGFVDSDDWIETDMYKVLLKRAEDTGADVVECGWINEYHGLKTERTFCDAQYCGDVALREMIKGGLSEHVWNKLWKRSLFYRLIFPEGRVFEDIAVTHQAYLNAINVCTLEDVKYHYLRRKTGLMHKTDIQSLVDYWILNKERYNRLIYEVDEQQLLIGCARAIGRMWGHYYENSLEERKKYNTVVMEMNDFAMDKIPLFGNKSWTIRLRVASFLPHFNSCISFRLSWLMYRLYEGIRDRRLFNG